MSVLPLDADTQALLRSLQSDYDSTTPDAHVIAEQVSYQRGKQGHPAAAQDLAASITSIAFDHTVGAAGAPTLVLTFADPRWAMMDSGFFDADSQGNLLDLDLNYPLGSRFWWRLHQLSPQHDYTIQLTFLPRIVSELIGLRGPIKVNRAKRTRAQFLQMLCAKVTNDAQGPIEFHCSELDVVQPIGNSGPSVSTTASSKIPAGKNAAKHVGVGANRKSLTVKGLPMTAAQAQTANIILQQGNQLRAPRNAVVAAIYAAIGESTLGANPGGVGGVFQTTCSAAAYSGGSDTAAQAKGFYTGGTCFQAGGAIKCAVAGDPPWMIANEVEANGVWNTYVNRGKTGWGDSYTTNADAQKARTVEAAGIVDGGGGTLGSSGGTATIEVAQPYYFAINPGEDYWTGMNRLAQEVAWELIVSGNRIFYDPDTVLIRQKIAAVLDRDDATTLEWNYDWENRHIATNFQVQVVCEPFEFEAGDVVQVTSFGAASTGSTVKLPGRWLINEAQRNGGDLFSTLSLVQPTPPLPEPVPQLTTETIGRTGSAQISGSIQSQTPGTPEAAFAAAQYLSSLKLIYTKGFRTMVRNIGDHKGQPAYDCSASVSWVLLAAGFKLPGGVTWGGDAPVSGAFTPGAAGLQSGPGQNMTIYADADHIFIRIHPTGLADMQGNTVNPFGPGFGFYAWANGWPGSGSGPSPHPGFWLVHYPGT